MSFVAFRAVHSDTGYNFINICSVNGRMASVGLFEHLRIVSSKGSPKSCSQEAVRWD